jgi:hypothetical protein
MRALFCNAIFWRGYFTRSLVCPGARLLNEPVYNPMPRGWWGGGGQLMRQLSCFCQYQQTHKKLGRWMVTSLYKRWMFCSTWHEPRDNCHCYLLQQCPLPLNELNCLKTLSWETSSCLVSQQIFSIIMFKRVCHWSLSVQPDESSLHPQILFKVHFNIIIPCTLSCS